MKNEPKTRREREVWGACDALYTLHGEFEKITGDNLRDQLVEMGHKKGSPNEVYKYRKTWVSARGILTEKGGDESPHSRGRPENDDPITRAVGLVHEQLKAESQNELERIRKNYEDTISSLTDRKDELEQLAQGQAEELAALKLEVRGQKSDIKNLTRDLKSKSEENLVLDTRSKELSVHLKQNQDFFKGLKHTIEQAHKYELDELRKSHRAEMDEKKKHIQTLKSDLKSLGVTAMDEANGLRADAKNLQKKLDQGQKQLAQSQTSESKLEGELKAVKVDFKVWIASQSKLDESFEKWAGRWHQILVDASQEHTQKLAGVEVLVKKIQGEIKKQVAARPRKSRGSQK